MVSCGYWFTRPNIAIAKASELVISGNALRIAVEGSTPLVMAGSLILFYDEDHEGHKGSQISF